MLKSLSYRGQLCGALWNGTVSRIFSTPTLNMVKLTYLDMYIDQRLTKYCTSLSKPSPKPPVGAAPWERIARYQSSPLSPCQESLFLSLSGQCSLTTIQYMVC